MSIFKGCATALVTPFSDSGVDYDSLGRLIDFQIENDVGALVILGTTGEAATMSEDEKIDVVKFSVKAADGRVPVIVGSGSNDTKSAVRLSRLFSSLGADALLVVTPFYNKCTQSGLVAHYSEIATSVDKPVIVYNVPARTGVNVLPETFRKLAKIKNVVAIKEAAGDLSQMSDTIMLSGDADVFSGDDNLTVPAMCMGASGVISVAANLFPKFVSAMTKAALLGNYDKAAKMQLKINPLIHGLFSEVNPIPIKYALNKFGLCKNILRLPLTTMSKANSDKLDVLIDDFLS